jgi:hypothetical protein
LRPAKQRASAGRGGDEYLVQAERPSAEAGEGVAEGFELAEDDLVEAAERRVPGQTVSHR